MDKKTLETANKLNGGINEIKAGLEDVEHILKQATDEKKRAVYRIEIQEMPTGEYEQHSLQSEGFFNYIGRDFYKYLEQYRDELKLRLKDLEKRFESL